MNSRTDEMALAQLQQQTRRHFLQGCTTGLGALWLATQSGFAKPKPTGHQLQFKQRAKRVIFLHMAGGPSQLELFDYKPELAKHDGKDCPQSFLEGKQFAFIQGTPKMLGPQAKFQQAGQSGHWVSELMPQFASVADETCMIHSMKTDQFNHAPAQLVLHTGTQNLGFPSAGSWVTYGLGSENENLPGFIVLVSGGKTPSAGKSVWGSGFLPSVHQGVQCRSKGDPVLYLSNPKGITPELRSRTLTALNEINHDQYREEGDPETLTRIAQYEMAHRMQTSASEAFDLNQEPEFIRSLYGAQPGEESFANNCLLARRLAERGVRYIQLFDWGWDSHGASANEALNGGFVDKCANIDKPIAGLLTDLKQRGLLEDTLVAWGGEFGRTPMRENRNGQEMKFVGRDHNPGAFTVWMAGGGVKPGFSLGATDELGYEAALDPVSPHDLHATMLQLLGFDHRRLTFPSQGLDMRLTNVTKHSHVVEEIIA
ncbi:MAG: DUF1501 domain-containing protein [Verrucomicrobiota bacterium]